MEIRIGDVARAAMSARGIHRMEIEAIIATPDTVEAGDLFVRYDGHIGGRRLTVLVVRDSDPPLVGYVMEG